MARKPDFITFTGVDQWTPIDGMRALSDRYPIEWAVLFSPKRQGIDPRYPPDGDSLSEFMWADDLRKAGHLCGDYSACVMRELSIRPPVDLGYFDRLQINHGDPKSELVAEFGRNWGPRCIVQTRSETSFPTYTRSVDWLYDASGGRGIAPKAWPPHPGSTTLVGYAGGLGPENVRAAIEQIDASGPYWIDMESGVRTADRFDLNLCARVCENVFEKQFA